MRKIRCCNNLCRSASRERRGSITRRGIVSLQIVFILPLLVIATIAVVQFGMQIVARQAITASAISGARSAARGGNVREVTQAVAKTLATDKIGVGKHGNTVILIEEYGRKPQASGNERLKCQPAGPHLRPGEIRVTVSVRGGNRGSSRIPNWLGALGRPLSPARIQSSALLTVE